MKGRCKSNYLVSDETRLQTMYVTCQVKTVQVWEKGGSYTGSMTSRGTIMWR